MTAQKIILCIARIYFSFESVCCQKLVQHFVWMTFVKTNDILHFVVRIKVQSIPDPIWSEIQ